MVKQMTEAQSASPEAANDSLGDKLRQYATLDREIKRLENHAKRLREQRDLMEEPLKDAMIDMGIPTLKVKGVDMSQIVNGMDAQTASAYTILKSVAMGLRDVLLPDEAIETALDATRQYINQSSNVGATIYIDHRIWAGAVQGENGEPQHDITVRALKQFPPTAHLVEEKFNIQSLSKWVREELERDELDDPVLPLELRDKVRVSRVEKLKVRKS